MEFSFIHKKYYDNYLHVNNPKTRKVVLNLLEEENFIDVWRIIMLEDTKRYTWRRLNPTKKEAWLDYFLVNDPLSSFVVDSDIVPGYRTDHSGIIIKLKLQEYERGEGYWKFNNKSLKDKKYIEEVKRTIMEVKNTYIFNNTDMENTTDDKIQFNINDQFFF